MGRFARTQVHWTATAITAAFALSCSSGDVFMRSLPRTALISQDPTRRLLRCTASDKRNSEHPTMMEAQCGSLVLRLRPSSL